MPRKTKEIKELETQETNPQKTTSTKKTSTKSTTKKATTKSKSKTTKNTTKITPTKSKTKKVETATKSKIQTEKKASTTKKITATSNKKSTSSQTKLNKKITNIEYYDLPYRYNQTIIKVLSQTPKTLFIYWEISDEDRKNFENQYGKNFFQDTKPVLIIYNHTLNYKFEVEINDFANSWYLHVADSKCEYQIELGRRPYIRNEKINTDYIYVTTSNQIESSNDRILFDKKQKMVYFRNIKTNIETAKPIKTISFMKNMGKIYDIYDLYKIIYQKENIEEIYNHSNPSSQNPSSQFK